MLKVFLGQILVAGCRPTTSIKQREDVSQSTGGSKQKVNGRSDIVAFSPALGLQSPTKGRSPEKKTVKKGDIVH